MYCPGYNNIRNELHSLLSTHNVVFKSLNEKDKIQYLLTLLNEITLKIVGKYTYLMFQNIIKYHNFVPIVLEGVV